MNIVKITNKIALYTVVLLIYWVFIFVCTTVFGFKVFRENMTEAFLLSIFGLFSILGGSIVLNIMYNLTAIAEGGSDSKKSINANPKKVLTIFISSLVVVFALLYVGDKATSNKKEAYLVSAAADLIKEQHEIIKSISSYTFTKTYINNTGNSIKVLSEVEEKFPQVTVVVRDSINGKPILFGFSRYSDIDGDKEPSKEDFILSTSSEEREYLNSVFDNKTDRHRFSSNDGQYEIYFPVKIDGHIIVIHLSQHNRYGKSGS